MKVLNLYACLGGNRLLWENCEVTAIELDPELARLYKERFPNDVVIVTDAHQYLLEHFKEFDFIWSSPPCPSHSRVRVTQKNREGFKYLFPDLKLYEEIIFLDNFFEGKYVVENVIPYYEPLIVGNKRGRHIYWTNFILPSSIGERKLDGILCEMKNEVNVLSEFHKYDFKKYKGNQSLSKIARNLVDYEAGKTIFNVARGIFEKSNILQLELI